MPKTRPLILKRRGSGDVVRFFGGVELVLGPDALELAVGIEDMPCRGSWRSGRCALIRHGVEHALLLGFVSGHVEIEPTQAGEVGSGKQTISAPCAAASLMSA